MGCRLLKNPFIRCGCVTKTNSCVRLEFNFLYVGLFSSIFSAIINSAETAYLVISRDSNIARYPKNFNFNSTSIVALIVDAVSALLVKV